MPSILRNATLQDAGELTEIYNYYVVNTAATFEIEPLTVSEMRQRMVKIMQDAPYLVLEEKGKVVGYSYVHPWHERAAYALSYEVTIYLRHGFEGNGRGSILMKRLIEESRKKGIHALIACITAENQVSRRFHEAFGFRQVSSFKEVGRKAGHWYGVTDYELLL